MGRKTPEQYLKEHVILPEEADEKGSYSSYELEFIKKYLGEETPPVIDVHGQKISEPSAYIEDDIRSFEEVQLVGFEIGDREIAFPIHYVQEVIKMVNYTKLPSSPPNVVGVINLRNNIVPLLDVYPLICDRTKNIEDYRFIVICNFKEFKIGVLVERITTMHKVPQQDLEWNIDSRIGASGVTMGLIKKDERLIGIMDINKLVEIVMGS
ncbi:chemotaxis protein CheW [Desulfothermus okinawensis JCM 13304]